MHKIALFPMEVIVIITVHLTEGFKSLNYILKNLYFIDLCFLYFKLGLS